MKKNEELLQKHIIDDFFVKELPDWITVYSHKKLLKDQSKIEIFRHSCICPVSYVEKALEDNDWDLEIGHGNPTLIEQCDHKGKLVAEYSRYGNDDGLEPIVIAQDIPGATENPAPRVSEELILFLNLYRDGDTLYAVDDSGEAEEAVRYRDKEITIRKKYLMHFMSAKQMALLLFIQNTYSTTEKHTGNPLDKIEKDTSLIYHLSTLEDPGPQYKSATCLIGKRIILPAERNIRRQKQYEKFIYKEDSTGEPLEFSCNPKGLGKNGTSPGYLTPIYFSKSVLKKYYDDSIKYTVSDGDISCDGLWSLQIDNDRMSTIMVFLGDLGKLPSKEQRYWRSFNIPPSDNSISRTNCARSFLGAFCDAKSPEFEFKQLYRDFNNKWQNEQGWSLLRSGNTDNVESDLKKFRIPLSYEDSEFKNSLLLLSKLLNDRLDKANIKKHINRPLSDEEEKFGSIKLLKIYIEENNIGTEFAKVLENIQLLRSKGVAHTEQSGYQEALKTILGEETKIQLITDMIFTINNFLRC